jgi:hypothetical protein
MRDVKNADDLIAQLTEWVDEAEMATAGARSRSERDRDYYDGKQWTDEELETLAKRNQPPITFNRIKRKVDFMVGFEIQQRTDPKAFPRNPQDEGAAEAATDALRYVADNNAFPGLSSSVWENMLIEGAGGCEVGVRRKKKGGFEITFTHIPWDRMIWDPASMRHDFADARYLGTVVWMDADLAKAKWPKGAEAIDASLTDEDSLYGDTWDDKPRETAWGDREHRRVKLVQMCFRWIEKGEARWHWCLFTKGGKIAGGISDYLDDEGDPECPLIFASAYVDRDNNRYGVVRDMVSPQDASNKHRSVMLYTSMMRQIIMDEGALGEGGDVRKVKAELAKPDGVVTLSGSAALRFEVVNGADRLMAMAKMLAEADSELEQLGPNAAMVGQEAGQASGRAILASQQGGAVEMLKLLDRHRQWKIRVFRAAWNRVKQFWDEERWIRVTDDENKPKFVGLNRAVTMGEAFLTQLQQQGATPEDVEMMQQQIANDPRARMVIGRENSVGEMDMDIIVEDAPDTITIQHEQFDQLVRLAEAGIPIPPDILIEMMPNLRNRKAILDRMSGMNDPAQQAMMKAQQELQMRGATAEVEKTEAEAFATKAKGMDSIASAAERRVRSGQQKEMVRLN